MRTAKFIGITNLRGVWKNRWECTDCKANKQQPESRFNLSIEKDNQIHKCRFCGKKLLLKK